MRRPRRFFLPALVLLVMAVPAVLAQMESGDRGILPVDSSQTLEIGGIHVDVGGKDSEAARFAGWRIAQREGFKALWAKVHGATPDKAPNLADSVLDGLVSSIVVEKEQIGPTRYIADLGILFDRQRAGELLGVGGPVRRSAPMLLIPITTSGGTQTSVELKNAWQRAWAEFRTAQSPIDYVRVSGMGADPLFVNAAQVRRPGRGWWRNVLDLYGAANVLVADVDIERLYPGGPARATFTGSFGPDRKLLGSFYLEAKNSADIPRMMREGAQQMDALFARAFAAGIVKGDSSLIIQPPPPPPEEVAKVEAKPAMNLIQLVFTVPDSASLESAIGQLQGIAGVRGVTPRTVVLGGTSVMVVGFDGNAAALRSALVARGWAVDYVGGLLRAVRPNGPVPAPAPPIAPTLPAPGPPSPPPGAVR